LVLQSGEPEFAMRTFRATIAALALFATSASAADPRPGDEGTSEYEAASKLVRNLGHSQYVVREAAAKKLVEMGNAAVPALRAGTASADEEVRSRCVALIPQARAAERKLRTDAYVADTDGRRTHDLPLVAEWEELLGKPDAGSRALFAQVFRADSDFLEAVAAHRKQATALCAARCQSLLDRPQSPDSGFAAAPGELLAVLFVDAIDPVWLGLPSPGMPADLLRNPALADALGTPLTGRAVGRLMSRWVMAHAEIDPRPRMEFAGLVRRKPFPEALPALAGLAKDKLNPYPVTRLLAVESLGAVGGQEAAAVLAELIAGDDYAFSPRGPWLGDQALAASLAVHGKKAQDFGLRDFPTSVSFPSPFGGKRGFPLTLYEFPTNEARDEAFQKWRDEVAGKK
jgi:hypothetical protein